MYKIGIIGHGPERLEDPDKVQRLVGYTIDLLALQYGEDEIVFNIRSSIGVGLWATEECIDRDYKYHLFLPYSVEKTSEHWYEDQQQTLLNQYQRAYSLTICNPDSHGSENEHKQLIDNVNFVVCFWRGIKQGETASAIRYALENNKLVVNAMNDLKLVTNLDFRKETKWKVKKELNK